MHRAARLIACTLLLPALLLPEASAHAQASGMPGDIEAKLAEMGAVVNPPETAKLYAPLQEKEPYAGIKVTRDLKYGAHERHALDVFEPEPAAASRRAVLMFVHGGAFTAGNKRAPGSPFYDNVALFAVRNGFVGVNITYRLAPQHQWPAAAEDVGAAVRWVGENIGTHGGDPARVFLMGHSAGAVHVASYIAHPKFHTRRDTGLTGAILLSGTYDLGKFPVGPPEKAYFGEDAAKLAEASTLALLPETKIRVMAIYAERDPAAVIEQGKLLQTTMCRANRCSSVSQLARHSHMSEVYALNTPDRELSDQIVAFIKGGK